MGRRVFLSAVLLAIGGGIGFAACWFARPTPTPVPQMPAHGDEVVVEIRVKLPPGAIRPNDFRHSASSAQQGALIHTCQPFDLAIEGAGFFQVTLPNGETAYTRDGSFGLSPQGSIVTREEHLLIPQFHIPLDTVDVSVGADGTVYATTATGRASVLDQLTLARFLNPGWLERDEHGLWRETAGSGPPMVGTPGSGTFGLIRQGFRERQAELDASMLVDLVRAIVWEDGRARVRVER